MILNTNKIKIKRKWQQMKGDLQKAWGMKKTEINSKLNEIFKRFELAKETTLNGAKKRDHKIKPNNPNKRRQNGEFTNRSIK